MKKRLGTITGLLLLGGVLVAAANGPMAQVKMTVDQVLAIVKDPALQGSAKQAERRRKLREVVFTRFGFREMAKRSLGIHWRDRSVRERDEFVRLFADLLERSYVGKIEAYASEQILFVGETVEGRYARVQTRIVTDRSPDIPIEYRLLMQEGRWAVYDVVIEGVSLVSNYRTQFNRIIVTSSYRELVKKMQVKEAAEKLGNVAPGGKR
ncbi:MAG: ABC transporter substrate-binding protein [Candidatus Methylomirabilales bacterium]